MIRSLALPAIAACALAVAPAAAQTPVAVTVTGEVRDASGRVLPGAAVEARRGLRVVAGATTRPDGGYRLDLPSEGDYRLTARLDGFAAGAADVTATGAATVDFRLDVAPLRDSVVVTASRTAERRAAVMASHSVFTADDVAALGSHSVADVLRYSPGLNVESTGREGEITSVYARGGEADLSGRLLPSPHRRRPRAHAPGIIPYQN